MERNINQNTSNKITGNSRYQNNITLNTYNNKSFNTNSQHRKNKSSLTTDDIEAPYKFNDTNNNCKQRKSTILLKLKEDNNSLGIYNTKRNENLTSPLYKTTTNKSITNIENSKSSLLSPKILSESNIYNVNNIKNNNISKERMSLINNNFFLRSEHSKRITIKNESADLNLIKSSNNSMLKNSVHINFKEKTSLSQYLKKRVSNDFTVFVFEIEYIDANQSVKWLIYKSLEDIIELSNRLLEFLSTKFHFFNNQKKGNRNQSSKSILNYKSSNNNVVGGEANIYWDKDKDKDSNEASIGIIEFNSPVASNIKLKKKRNESIASNISRLSLIDELNEIENIKKKENQKKPLRLITIKSYLKEVSSLKVTDPHSIINLLKELNSFEETANSVIFHEFLEISKITFDSLKQGYKPTEGIIMKKSFFNNSNLNMKYCCCNFLMFFNLNPFKKRWFVLNEEYFCYMDSSIGNIGRLIFWFDQELDIYRESEVKVKLNSGTRMLILKFDNLLQAELWFNKLTQKRDLAFHKKKNKYDSFAPERTFCKANFFVNAFSYYNHLYYELMSAKESIFICGWMVSPELPLIRPSSLPNGKYLLKDVLKEKAEQGVKVYILVWNEFTLSVNINSSHTKETLNCLHENIRVVRHPKSSFQVFWSHHEKIVIIDQKVGYVGGIDLCWGRYETDDYHLIEPSIQRQLSFSYNNMHKEYKNADDDKITNDSDIDESLDYSNKRKKDSFKYKIQKLKGDKNINAMFSIRESVTENTNNVSSAKQSKNDNNDINFDNNYRNSNSTRNINQSLNEKQTLRNSEKTSPYFAKVDNDKSNVNYIQYLDKTSIYNTNFIFPGADYCNFRVSDYNDLTKCEVDTVDRYIYPRMPWHDIHVFIEGPAVWDLTRHFIERWNFARSSNVVDKERKYDIESIKTNIQIFAKSSLNKVDRLFGITKRNNNKNVDKRENNPSKPSNKRDNKKINTFNEEVNDSKVSINNSYLKINKNKISRKNTYYSTNNNFTDIDNENSGGLELQENLLPSKYKTSSKNKNANDLSFEENPSNLNTRNTNMFSLKRNSKRENTVIGNRSNDKNSISLFKCFNILDNNKASEEVNNNDIGNSNIRESIFNKVKEIGRNIKQASHQIKEQFKKEVSSFSKKNDELLGLTFANKPNITDNTEMNNSCQIIRSACYWSVGLDKNHENSILNAYYDLIDNSKHYIYLENQFFISKSYSNKEHPMELVENEIILAYKNNQKFRVFIFIPLLPGFAGEISETTTIQLIVKHTLKTLSRDNGFSMFEKLEKVMGEAYFDYIHVFSLRNHTLINGKPVTEQIYIHSKLMIVDDEKVLIGSANINDRSMLGNRDSEIGVVINDSNKTLIEMDGSIYKASTFAFNLRVKLFTSYLGLSNEESYKIEDALSDDFYYMIVSKAKCNSSIYREIFSALPDDEISDFDDLEREKNETKGDIMDKYLDLKDSICGYIVDFPLQFLARQYISRSYFCKEILVPLKSFL